MNAEGDGRKSYYVYDSLGNLVKEFWSCAPLGQRRLPPTAAAPTSNTPMTSWAAPTEARRLLAGSAEVDLGAATKYTRASADVAVSATRYDASRPGTERDRHPESFVTHPEL